MQAVAQVQPFWAQLTLVDRARYLERTAQVLIDDGDAIRDLIVREQGKPRNEAFSMELLPTIDALRWIGRAGRELLADEPIPMSQALLRTKQAAFVHEPLGVIGVISPWNFPWSIPFGEIALALMAGNGVVLKPASLTPLIGERIARAFERAGVPEGLVRVVHGPGTGPALVQSDVAKVFFTGSVETGRSVGEGCARQLKGSVLELGGKDPMLVLADAQLDHAVAGAVWGGFANAGQTHSGIERVYVVADVAERFIEGVVATARALRIGDPLGWETEVGPLTSAAQFEHVDALVADAVAAGAELRCGGPVDRPVPGCQAGRFYAPAVLTGVTRRDADHARGDLRSGAPDRGRRRRGRGGAPGPTTASSVSEHRCGRSTAPRAERIAGELQAGTVWINDHLFSHGALQCAWGGVKQSGLGRTHSKFGLLECVNVKTRVWEPSVIRNPWWHPYDETLGRALRQAAMVLYGRPSIRAAALRDGIAPSGTTRRAAGAGRAGAPLIGPSRARRAASVPSWHARPGLRRQGVRLPVPQGDLRPVLRAGHALDAVLHRLPAAEGAAMPGGRRG